MPGKHSGTLIPEAETVRNTIKLGDTIRTTYSEEGLALPKLVFMARGALEIAGTLSRHLELGASSILTAGVDKITADGDTEPKFEVGQFPTEGQVQGEHVLAVDVVCRSGEKLAFVTQRLGELGAESVRSAVLYDMSALAEDPGDRYTPDYFVQSGQAIGYAIFDWEFEEHLAEAEIAKRQIDSASPTTT